MMILVMAVIFLAIISSERQSWKFIHLRISCFSSMIENNTFPIHVLALNLVYIIVIVRAQNVPR